MCIYILLPRGTVASMQRSEGALQYVSLLVNKRNTPNESVKYNLKIGCWSHSHCLYIVMIYLTSRINFVIIT